jgi:hypothetical protein
MKPCRGRAFFFCLVLASDEGDARCTFSLGRVCESTSREPASALQHEKVFGRIFPESEDEESPLRALTCKITASIRTAAFELGVSGWLGTGCPCHCRCYDS